MSACYLRANFRRLKEFAKGIVKAFSVSRRSSVRIAFIAAWSQCSIVFNFNTRNKRVMVRSINRLRQKRGRLNLAKAIRRSRSIFASSRKSTPNVLLVITAGKSRGRLRSQSLAAQRSGITIITIGIIPIVDQTDLSTMSSPPAGGNRVVVNFLGLMNIIAVVVNKIILGMFWFHFILLMTRLNSARTNTVVCSFVVSCNSILGIWIQRSEK